MCTAQRTKKERRELAAGGELGNLLYAVDREIERDGSRANGTSLGQLTTIEGRERIKGSLIDAIPGELGSLV